MQRNDAPHDHFRFWRARARHGLNTGNRDNRIVAQADEFTLNPGDMIADYRIEKVLGAGSFGVTYQAHEVALDRRVAIKEYMPVQYARRDSAGTISSRNAETAPTFEWGLDRFSEEARTLAQFNHPNIVRVLRIVQGLNGTSYIVMEFLPGANLETVVERDGPLPTGRFVEIFAQILDGMKAVHGIGILHRDLKPANIVLDERGPVIIDFGAARELAMQQKAGFSALVTDGFSPPEQYSSKNIQSPASDVYALAATAHYLLSGEVPPPSAARHAGEEMAPAAQLRPDLPADIAQAIDRGLELKMADRPATIQEWIETMPSLNPAAVTQTEVVYVDRGGAGIDRRGLLLLGGGLLVAGGAGAWLFGRDRSVSGSATALTPRWRKTIGPVSSEPFPGIAVAGQDALVAAHTVGPDGNDHLLLARYDAQGNEKGRYVHDEPGSRGHAVLPMDDGGAVVAGENPQGALIVRLDSAMRPAWKKVLAPGSISSLMRLNKQIVAGLEGPESSGLAKLVFLSDAGDLANEIVLLDRRGDSVQQVAPLTDGTIAVLGARLEERIVGGARRNAAGLWLAKVNPSGEEMWRVAESGLGFANGLGLVEAGGDLFVSGKTSPDGEAATYRTMVLRVSGEGRKVWAKWDYDQGPSTGRGLAASADGTPKLYMAGWNGSPPRSRLMQIGPDGSSVWQQGEADKQGYGDVAADLALAADGSAWSVGLALPDAGHIELTIASFAAG